jgi:hypothetical protein
MKLLTNYIDFLISESIINASPKVTELLSKLNSKLGAEFYNIVKSKLDVNTDINTLDIGKKNDELLFIPDARTQKLLSDGEQPFDKNKQAMGIGRIVRSVLTKNGINFTDNELEEFVKDFKAKYDILFSEKNDNIRLVSGEEIRHWYYSENYKQSPKLNHTELGKSCMRYEECQIFFDIYVNNPNQCQMLIYTEGDKLLARALYWKLDDGNYYLDRIYAIENSDNELMINWVLDNTNSPKLITYNNTNIDNNRIVGRMSISNATITLENGGNYEYYPYMDTFCYYTPYTGVLSPRRGDYMIQDTEGYAQSTGLYCDFEGTEFPEYDVVYSSYHDVYMHKNNAVYSDYYESELYKPKSVYSDYYEDYLIRENSVYSNMLKSYIPTRDSVSVFIDEDRKETDWCLSDSKKIQFLEPFENDFYLKELTIKSYDGNYILKKWALDVYTINGKIPSLIEDLYKKMFEIDMISELDKKVYGIETDDNKEIIDIRQYYYFLLDNILYTEVIEIVEATKVSDEIKKEKIQEINKMHEYLLENVESYKNSF